MMGRWTLDASPVYLAMDLMSRVFSPYDLNPTGFNPLRQVLAESIDFERLATSPIKLFITATNVHTGRGRIFRNGQITPEVLLASACLPTMFRAVEIDGEPYWDGVSLGILLSRLLSARATRMIPSWSRSIPGSAGTHRKQQAISWTASTKSPSTRRS
jgi:predicted acylesterase/phospholipase RssA